MPLSNSHILFCFRGSPGKYFVKVFFFSWVILTSQLSFVSLAYPFTSLFIFKRRHGGIVVLFQAFGFSCVFHDFSEVTVEIALGCIGPAGVNLISPCNLKQINFSINSVSCSSLFLPLFLLPFCLWCACCLIAADLFVKKWSKKAQSTSVFLALSIFFPTGCWNIYGTVGLFFPYITFSHFVMWPFWIFLYVCCCYTCPW